MLPAARHVLVLSALPVTFTASGFAEAPPVDASLPPNVVTVALRDDALILSLGPDKQQHALRHWDGDVFHLRALGRERPGNIGRASRAVDF